MPDEEKTKKEGGVLQNKQLLNALASGFDPEVANWLDKLIAKIPATSPLRKPIVDRILAIAKSLLESQTEKKGPLASVAGEKITDYLDLSRTALSGKGSKEAKRKVTEVNSAEWMNRFFQYAEKRLAEAENPKEEQERLNEEFEARKAIFDLIKAAEEAARATGADEPEVPAAKPIDWNAKWETLKSRAESGWGKIDDAASKAAPPVGRLATWLESRI